MSDAEDIKLLKIDEEDRNWFLKHTREQSVHARQLLSVTNWEDLTRLFHNLRGSGFSYGFPEISEWGRKGESACEGRDGTKIRGFLGELDNYLSKR